MPSAAVKRASSRVIPAVAQSSSGKFVGKKISEFSKSINIRSTSR